MTISQNSLSRDRSVDIAKGIGIISVVYGHLNCPIHDEIYLFHMPLFFFLSGLFFSTKYTPKEFLIKKTRALIVPAILFYVLSFIAGYLLSNYNNLKDYIDSFSYFLAPNGVLWFLLSLYQIFIIGYVVERNIQSVFIKIIIALIITSVGYVMAVKRVFFFYFPEACLGYLFFYLGFLFRKYGMLKRRHWPRWLLWGAFVGYIMGMIFNVQTDMAPLVINKTYVLFFLPAIGGSLLILYLAKIIQNKKYTGWLISLGRNSLLVMCVHSPLNPLVSRISFWGITVLYTYLGKEDLLSRPFTGMICGVLTLIILVPLSLYVGLGIKKIFSFCFH